MKLIIDVAEDVYTRLFDSDIQDNEIATDDICEMARALRLGVPILFDNAEDSPTTLSASEGMTNGEVMQRGKQVMTDKEAIEWLIAIKEKYISGGDEGYDEKRKQAIDKAVRVLEDQMKTSECKNSDDNVEFWKDVTFGNNIFNQLTQPQCEDYISRKSIQEKLSHAAKYYEGELSDSFDKGRVIGLKDAMLAIVEEPSIDLKSLK